MRVVADAASTRDRLAQRMVERAEGDHSDADVRVWERMAAREFEPPAGAFFEVRNGPELADDLGRVVAAVEQACAAA